MVAKIDRELDVTGDVCPIPFVKAKLTLESMAPGQLLRVIVDYRPAFDSMPLSLALEGHDVLWAGPIGDGSRRVGKPAASRSYARDGALADGSTEGSASADDSTGDSACADGSAGDSALAGGSAGDSALARGSAGDSALARGSTEDSASADGSAGDNALAGGSAGDSASADDSTEDAGEDRRGDGHDGHDSLGPWEIFVRCRR